MDDGRVCTRGAARQSRGNTAVKPCLQLGMECRIVRQGLWWSESACSAWLILAKRGYCRAGLGQERCCGRAMCRHGSFIGCRGVAYNSVGYHRGTTVSRFCRSLALGCLGVGPPSRRYFFRRAGPSKKAALVGPRLGRLFGVWDWLDMGDMLDPMKNGLARSLYLGRL